MRESNNWHLKGTETEIFSLAQQEKSQIPFPWAWGVTPDGNTYSPRGENNGKKVGTEGGGVGWDSTGVSNQDWRDSFQTLS